MEVIFLLIFSLPRAIFFFRVTIIFHGKLKMYSNFTTLLSVIVRGRGNGRESSKSVGADGISFEFYIWGGRGRSFFYTC